MTRLLAALACLAAMTAPAAALDWHVTELDGAAKLGLVSPDYANTFVGVRLECDRGSPGLLAFLDVYDLTQAGRSALARVESPAGALEARGTVTPDGMDDVLLLPLASADAVRLLAILEGEGDLTVRIAGDEWSVPLAGAAEARTRFREICGV